MRCAFTVASTVVVGLLAAGVSGCAPRVQTTGAASSTPSATSTISVSPTTSPAQFCRHWAPRGTVRCVWA